MIHLVLFLLLIIALAFAAVPESKQPDGVAGGPFVSRRKWSSTGMGGLDHHYPESPIEEVKLASELTSKKSKRKPEDPSVHPEGECSDWDQPELDTLLSLTLFAPSCLSTGHHCHHAFENHPYASGCFAFDD